MVIEERELHYPPDSPLHAWRLFRVRAFDQGVALSSPMYHDPDPPPWPHSSSVAACYHDHRAPAPGCRCVIYATVPGTLEVIRPISASEQTGLGSRSDLPSTAKKPRQ